MQDPRAKRLAKILLKVDARGRRLFDDRQLRSLAVYLAALEGKGSPAELERLGPPPAALVDALLELVRELRDDAQGERVMAAAQLLGSVRSAPLPIGQQSGDARALFARFAKIERNSRG